MNRSPLRILLALVLGCVALVLMSAGSLKAQAEPTTTPAVIPSSEPAPAPGMPAEESRPSDPTAPTAIMEVAEMTLGAELPEMDAVKTVPGAITPDTNKRVPPAMPGDMTSALVEEKTESNVPAGQPEPGAVTAWTTVKYEGFEGVWPNSSWSAFDNNGATNGEIYWDDENYLSYSGNWSGWAAGGGAHGLDPWYDFYADNMRSWAVYGPFDLSKSIDAEMLFYFWNQSEYNYDWFSWMASANGTNFYGYKVSGDSGGWNYVNFDLTAVPSLGSLVGDSSVWIAFTFVTDGSLVDDGAFIDDITIRKNTSGGGGCPAITAWKGEYWNNASLSGAPVLCRNDRNVNFTWAYGSPNPSIPSDYFSARWTRQLNLRKGRYRFMVGGDDGIRLWVDGRLLINRWYVQGYTEYSVTTNLSQGLHSVKVEYFENDGYAKVRLVWNRIGAVSEP